MIKNTLGNKSGNPKILGNNHSSSSTIMQIVGEDLRKSLCTLFLLTNLYFKGSLVTEKHCVAKIFLTI